jgi:hypothetical protein
VAQILFTHEHQEEHLDSSPCSPEYSPLKQHNPTHGHEESPTDRLQVQYADQSFHANPTLGPAYSGKLSIDRAKYLDLQSLRDENYSFSLSRIFPELSSHW